ncbi:hypothetical protein M0R45_009067 [Rubus argutus]|uniref:Uncharacterized protein n=1 Tax=Rubus argutus TaxID=59490 RepID=A0AAW1Y344_RUBAR
MAALPAPVQPQFDPSIVAAVRRSRPSTTHSATEPRPRRHRTSAPSSSSQPDANNPKISLGKHLLLTASIHSESPSPCSPRRRYRPAIPATITTTPQPCRTQPVAAVEPSSAVLLAARLAPSATHSESPSLCYRARNSAPLLVSISFTAAPSL